LRQIYAKAQKVLQLFGDSSLCDPQTSAGEAKTPGRGESAKLKAGKAYRFVISDRSDIHDFHLKRVLKNLRPGVG
jgi:hypothetical protein